MKYFIGIDPGLKGGIAVVDSEGNLVVCETLPSLKELSVKGRNISRPDIKAIFRLLSEIKLAFEISVVMIEKQMALPGQNSVGTFNTGKGYGIILAAATGMFSRSEIKIITCKEWQEKMIQDRTFIQSKIRRDRRKQLKLDSIKAAQELFPDFSFKKSIKSKADSDGLSDSALIAAYCRLTYVNSY